MSRFLFVLLDSVSYLCNKHLNLVVMIPQKKENADMSVEMRLARRIKAIRILRGYNQKELAAKCGMSSQTLSNIECGKSDFRIGTLKTIEEVLQCALILIPNEDLI